MKLTTIIFLFSLVLCVKSQKWLVDAARFVKEAALGAGDMARAYSDMREANFKNSDKYFHARGNYDAAQRGPGGVWAAEKISNAREFLQGGSSGKGVEDSKADQFANKWGRDGKDPNYFRPRGLNPKY
ncbi:serum amyloid A protein-like [Macrotis lagotis]|uniref:serum amyloid A protein-like n=1 Tax=Macrotis lagotis TaxID=92651 RepID=UPI003D698253